MGVLAAGRDGVKKADDKTGEACLAAGAKALKDAGQDGEIYKSWLQNSLFDLGNANDSSKFVSLEEG